MVQLLDEGTISSKIGKEVFERMYRTGEEPGTIISTEDLGQISDTGELEELIDRLLESNQKQGRGLSRGEGRTAGFLHRPGHEGNGRASQSEVAQSDVEGKAARVSTVIGHSSSFNGKWNCEIREPYAKICEFRGQPSFIPQTLNRIQAGSLDRRPDSKDHPHRNRHQEPRDHRPKGDGCRERRDPPDHQVTDQDRKDNPQDSSDTCQRYGFEEKLRDDVPAPCTNGLSNTRSLLFSR